MVMTAGATRKVMINATMVVMTIGVVMIVHDNRGRRPVHYANWHDRGRHEGWYHRGGYLPVEYRTRYVVTDWRRDRLRPPPRGYHWVRSDNGDFLLVAIASGVIASILLAH